MNNPAVDVCVQVSVWTHVSILLGLYLGVELVGQRVTLCLLFEELPDCFPQQLHCFASHQQCRRV